MNKTLYFLATILITFSVQTGFADTIKTFYVNAQGVAVDFPGYAPALEGDLTIDVTNGTVVAANIAGCDFIEDSEAQFGGWFLVVGHEDFFNGTPIFDPSVWLFFTTTNPGSLVGFNGGTVFDGQFRSSFEGIVFEDQVQGTITVTPVPEPSTLALVLTGVGLLAGKMRTLGT